MTKIPRLPYRAWLLAALLALFGVSAVGVKYPADFVWEHVLTAAALAFLVWLDLIRRPLSNAANTLIFIYLSIHLLGAHYTYSEVPYDDWTRNVFGTSVSEFFGQQSERNHFDRFVHFIFGILLLHPVREVVQRAMRVKVGHAILIAALVLITFGTLYELLEWCYAVIAGQEAAERYNGQQGDMFDAQKDITLNVMGTMIGAALSAAIKKPRMNTDGHG